MRFLLLLLLLLLLQVAGCGSNSARNPVGKAAVHLASGQAAPEDQNGKPANDADAAKVARKIKYTADIRLITEDFAPAERRIKELIKSHEGDVAKSEVIVTGGSVRQGSWRVRVPVKEFDAFRDAILTVADVEKNTSDSEDLTEEYYDLDSHIKNKQSELEGLRKLMEKAGDKMEDFLAVRREIAQVQDDLQRKIGRLKLLANLTDLTTVSITLSEKQKYLKEKGPEPAETPTFNMRAGKTFDDSLGAVKDLGAELAIVTIAITPWLPLALVVYVIARLILRRRFVPRRATPGGAEKVAETGH